MFQNGSSTETFVYPSWASLSYNWDDLDKILRDPLNSGFLDHRDDWDSLGYSREIHPYNLAPGPYGGGIISFNTPPMTKSLGKMALGNDTHFCNPVGTKLGGIKPQTGYLEPMDGPLTGIRFAPKELKKKQKIYTCITTAEESPNPNLSYWAICMKPGRWKPAQAEKVCEVANHFGVPLLAGISDDIKTHSFNLLESRRLISSETSILYFSMQNSIDDINYSYAVLVYSVYHLASIVKKQIACASLFAKSSEPES